MDPLHLLLIGIIGGMLLVLWSGIGGSRWMGPVAIPDSGERGGGCGGFLIGLLVLAGLLAYWIGQSQPYP